MLQFDKSQTTNTNAAYIEALPSGSYTELVIEVTQSYDRSTSAFEGQILSKPTQYNNWILFANSGSDVPAPSGQYDVNIFTGIIDNDLQWDEAAFLWNQANFKWSDSQAVFKSEFLYSDRAYISGSNESNITQYVSADENGTYTTYNG